MSQHNKEESPQDKGFAEILENFESGKELEPDVKKGQLVDGVVVAIDKTADLVYIDIGMKVEGKVSGSEFLDPPEVGDTVTVVVKRKEGGADGQFLLSKKEADLKGAWSTIRESYTNEHQVQGRIISEVKNKGFMVDVEGVSFFLPISQLGGKYKSFDEVKMKPMDFKIIELNERSKSGVVSRKQLLDEFNKEKWEELQSKVSVGDKVIATVSKVASFGVFCDVHGVIGLLRQNDISYKKFAPFKHIFKAGQQVELLVLEMDPENNRLALGLKQLYEDPWGWAKKELEKGMVIRGTVTSLTSFGAFIELKEGLEGLIHNTELTWAKKPPSPKSVLKKGDEVEALILDIDFDAKRLSLGLKQMTPNPWENLKPEVQVGSILEGKITGITKYGAFVEVQDDVEGLIHIKDITWDEKVKNPAAMLKKGDVVKYKILEVNTRENKISCGIKQLSEHPYEALKKKYPPGTIVNGKIKSITNFGIFLEIEEGFEGLIHISEIPNNKEINLEDEFHVGDELKAAVGKIDSESKKISLSVRDFERIAEREEMQKYMKSDDSPSTVSIGSLINQNKKD